ncbi:hypothetical protein K437DRAFT_112681 [Tilletiaria anomala UBC 951]|uniref:Uncharacterized protein n=1 Tax=Tilletiaria anomala (strain ATCC 24038 / CBS 436.72 / UBC 951) TaxID=1037660 RepID=A0A066VWW3_TILAU|nr:uncharacterized protein K437DRAFT_112681 [Tilletiaria anomala UBC 951]KDN45966.1 hypothetical protein K437DRAFT_112681 [Tilletiaria anomala UBC 951]
MLYDQAQNLASYVEAIQRAELPKASEDIKPFIPELRQAAAGISYYLLSQIASLESAFYASEDTDSKHTPVTDHGVEGAFQLWDWQDIEAALDGKDSTLSKLQSSICASRLTATSTRPQTRKERCYQSALSAPDSVEEDAVKLSLPSKRLQS